MEGTRQGAEATTRLPKGKEGGEDRLPEHNLFQQNEKEEILPDSFYETGITLIPNQTKYKRKKIQLQPISLMNVNTKIP